MSIPRGIRNNNPLNIRRSESHQARLNGRVSTDVDKVNIRRGSQWKGLSRVQSDPSFCQFETLEYGWRAAFCLLTKTYFARYHLETIRQLISRWAPASENNTRAYIQKVSRLTGIAPTSRLATRQKSPTAGCSSASQWPPRKTARRASTGTPCCEDGE